jgi:ElaB/YqjD/DUF883 family membrane-anchored ribosome-binding protein
MLQLRRATDQIFKRRSTDKLATSLAEVRDQVRGRMSEASEQGAKVARKAYEQGNEGARKAYDYAMNHPKAMAAVVLGAGVAAGLLWMIQRNGGYAAMRRKVLQRVRGSSSRTRRRVAAATE